MIDDAVVYAVIGDLVGSRRAPDRAALQDALAGALSAVNAHLASAVQPLQATVGDEFQGVYATLPEAVLAGLLVRLELGTSGDCRYGVGGGTTATHDASRSPVLQDGPAWWAARDAITAVTERATRPRQAYLRSWAMSTGADLSVLNALLICRDQMVDRLNKDGRRLLLYSLLGLTQREMAEREGVGQPAVSQRLARSGVNAIVDAHALLSAAD